MTDNFDDGDSAESLAAQLPLAHVVWRFLRSAYQQSDLRSVWADIDRALRLYWAQQWLFRNRADARRDGYELEEVAVALTTDACDHPLWPRVERVILRELRQTIPIDIDTCGIGTAVRVVAPDIELLYIHPTIPPGGVWQPGTNRIVVPILLRLDDSWRILNFGSDSSPQPGWPQSSVAP